MKLSKAQTDLLMKIRNGDMVRFIGGFDARYYFSKGMKNINWNTLHCLVEKGLLLRNDPNLSVTELGKTIKL